MVVRWFSQSARNRCWYMNRLQVCRQRNSIVPPDLTRKALLEEDWCARSSNIWLEWITKGMEGLDRPRHALFTRNCWLGPLGNSSTFILATLLLPQLLSLTGSTKPSRISKFGKFLEEKFLFHFSLITTSIKGYPQVTSKFCSNIVFCPILLNHALMAYVKISDRSVQFPLDEWARQTHALIHREFVMTTAKRVMHTTNQNFVRPPRIAVTP